MARDSAVNDAAPAAGLTGGGDFNAFDEDRNLRRLLRRRAPRLLDDHGARLSSFGAWVGGPLETQAVYSDRDAPPRLAAFGPDGERLGRVIRNPAYDACHAEAYRRGAIGLAYGPEAAGHLISFVMGYMLSQSDIAIHCPVTMTGAVAHVLDRLAPPAVRAAYLPALVRMDGAAVSAGTWATEIHGGSDVGATATEARPDGDAWRLTGVKWFASNAGGGLAMATARPAGAPDGGKGLGCYLIADPLPDGTPNRLWVRRLKDKLGTRALATGEIELDDAWALEIAGPPHGIKAMMEALEYSRIHNAMAACAVQRRAFREALAWSAGRVAFGQAIGAYPMVRGTLLDMVAELEACTALAMESALAFDAALADHGARAWLRTATALAKCRTAEEGVRAAARALELVGGNGYTEEWPTARLYRDAMVLPVWEGPGNIQALELLRATIGKLRGDRAFLARIGAVSDGLPAALATEAGILRETNDRVAAALAYLRQNPAEGPRHARRLLDLMADTLCAALLLEEAGADLATGDGRKALVARRYLTLHPARQGAIDERADPAHATFAAIVNEQAIDA
ncbi:MAG: acyl-CoA dehydrogenase family protein [Kiloniellaceae bacterium]